MLIFIFTALILGVGIWKNYRPQVVYASCSDIAEKTTFLIIKKGVEPISEYETYDDVLNNCLSDAGYFNE